MAPASDPASRPTGGLQVIARTATVRESIGPHFIWLVDGILCWEPHGVIRPEHATELVRRSIEQVERHGYLLNLTDARRLEPLSAEVRGIYAQAARLHAPRMALGVFGASMVIRAVQTLAMRAASLVSGVEIHFRHFDSREAALAFLRAQEVELRRWSKG